MKESRFQLKRLASFRILFAKIISNREIKIFLFFLFLFLIASVTSENISSQILLLITIARGNKPSSLEFLIYNNLNVLVIGLYVSYLAIKFIVKQISSNAHPTGSRGQTWGHGVRPQSSNVSIIGR